MKVSVEYQNFLFKYTMEYVRQSRVRRCIVTTLRGIDTQQMGEQAPFPFFVRLTQDECNSVAVGAVQVKSVHNLVLKNQDFFWKFSPHLTTEFHRLQKLRLERSLISVTDKCIGKIRFYKYPALRKQLSRQDVHVRPCLLPFLNGLKNALNELHSHSLCTS